MLLSNRHVHSAPVAQFNKAMPWMSMSRHQDAPEPSTSQHIATVDSQARSSHVSSVGTGKVGRERRDLVGAPHTSK
jgi:hypothetical protein